MVTGRDFYSLRGADQRYIKRLARAQHIPLNRIVGIVFLPTKIEILYRDRMVRTGLLPRVKILFTPTGPTPSYLVKVVPRTWRASQGQIRPPRRPTYRYEPTVLRTSPPRPYTSTTTTTGDPA